MISFIRTWTTWVMTDTRLHIALLIGGWLTYIEARNESMRIQDEILRLTEEARREDEYMLWRQRRQQAKQEGLSLDKVELSPVPAPPNWRENVSPNKVKYVELQYKMEKDAREKEKKYLSDLEEYNNKRIQSGYAPILDPTQTDKFYGTVTGQALKTIRRAFGVTETDD